MPEGEILIKSEPLSIKKNKSQEDISPLSYLNKE